MANDFLTTYKYGWKTSYYQNTNDLKSDEVEDEKSLEVTKLTRRTQYNRGGRV